MPDPTIEPYMTRSPHTIDSSEPLVAAHKMMRQHAIRHLPVVSDGELVGVVSMGDLHLLETLRDVDAFEVTIAEAVGANPYVVTPRASVREVAREMASRKLSAAVVTDANEVVGIFTTVDALNALLDISAPG